MKPFPQFVLFLGILLICDVGFSFEEKKQILPEKAEQKKGYLANKLFSKFQSLKNYITIAIPTKIQGPVLYKPYLNYNNPHQAGNGPTQNEYPVSNLPSAMRQKGTAMELLHNWKKQKKQEIKDVKEAIKNKVESEATAAETLAQRKHLAILRHHHMHGIVDMYRPQNLAASPVGIGYGWGWKETNSAPSRYKPKKKKKMKMKKPKTKKKPKKKKMKKKASGGWGEQGSALAPVGGWGSESSAPVKTLPKKRKKVKVKTKNKKSATGWGSKTGVSSASKDPVASVPSTVNILPAAGSRTTTTRSGLYAYPQLGISTHKVKDAPPIARINSKRVDENKSLFDFARRTLDTSGSLEDIEPDRMHSVEIVRQHNRRQKQRYNSGRPTLLSRFHEKLNEDDDELRVMPLGMEPRHELHFRQMPLIYEEFHDTSIYAPF